MSMKETLTQAVAARIDEVTNYQINIDNYLSAMQKIEQRYKSESKLDKAMWDFYNTLKSLHETSVIEREKASLMLEVVKEQLGEQ